MKTAGAEALPLPRWRVLDFVELTKPRIAVLVLFTVAVGAILAGRGTPEIPILVNTLIGTALIAAAASAFNQLLERHSDSLMRRTENRPLPSGRLQPAEVVVFGLVLAGLGLGWLAVTAKHPLAIGVAAFTLVSYVAVYTPLKRHTTLNTLVGALPGALPPVIGWTAIAGTLDREIVTVFLMILLWQVPHFLAIAWIYREDYARAGLQMLPVVDPTGAVTGRQMVSYCMALVPVSLLPVIHGYAGPLYAGGALLLGAAFTLAAAGFIRSTSQAQARRVLHVSLVYLPLLLGLLLVNVWTR